MDAVLYRWWERLCLGVEVDLADDLERFLARVVHLKKLLASDPFFRRLFHKLFRGLAIEMGNELVANVLLDAVDHERHTELWDLAYSETWETT